MNAELYQSYFKNNFEKLKVSFVSSVEFSMSCQVSNYSF